MCGLEYYTFERLGLGFEHHTRNDHNLWNYLMLFCYVKQKEPSEYTAQVPLSPSTRHRFVVFI